jgi:hypothetical protein
MSHRRDGWTVTTRATVVSFVIDIYHREFSEYPSSVLFLAVNCMDRYLSLSGATVELSTVQFFATIMFSIAHKYENHEALSFSYLNRLAGMDVPVSLMHDRFRRGELLILRRLEYSLSWPGYLVFLSRLHNTCSNSDGESGGDVWLLADCFLQTILLSHTLVAELSSKIAAATYFLARSVFGDLEWVSFGLHSDEGVY